MVTFQPASRVETLRGQPIAACGLRGFNYQNFTSVPQPCAGFFIHGDRPRALVASTVTEFEYDNTRL
jgi:hypothetical protein